MHERIKRILEHRGFKEVEARSPEGQVTYVVFTYNYSANIPLWLDVLQIVGNQIVAMVDCDKLEHSCPVCGDVIPDNECLTCKTDYV
jgi:hypothetical protein